jgi:hypothetical protein
MDSDQTSLDLLSHFDRPKTLSLAEYRELDKQPPAPPCVRTALDVDAPQEPSAEPATADLQPGADRPKGKTHSQQILQRDARWILKWAAALAIVAIAATQLTAFCYLCETQHALNLAARAGASESILPRATYETICAAIARRLANYPQAETQLQVTVLQNGRPIGRRLRFDEEDCISVMISAPASAMTPSWLARLPQWRGDVLITAMADRTMPSHKLRPEHSQAAAE